MDGPVVTKFGLCLDQAAMHITQVMGGVHLHVHTCARADVHLFRILETAGRIVLKFGVCLETH